MPNGHTITPEQHAAIARLAPPTFWSVADAYRARRQLGEKDHPAALAALEAFRATMPDVPEVEARATVRLIIVRAARDRPGWFWYNVR
jgi:hypothetical protein